MNVVNISTYKFAPLDNLKPLRAQLLAQCKGWEVKGTILLSTEGINLFVAGASQSIDQLLHALEAVPGLGKLTPKISHSAHQPFSRMLVRIKKEIIAFGVQGINPALRTSPKLAPRELKNWLDQGKPLTLLDTRNDYEIKLGTFKNAVPIGINHFRNFPSAVDALPEEMKQRPIVMFCTGGIRCEKAGPYMESRGFEVFQLDGGILKYFEECGNTHYEGDCFVFDQRVGVDASLEETTNVVCFACLSPLTDEEQRDDRYRAGESCPYCFKSDVEQRQIAIEKRHAAIRRVTVPLPGSVPYDQFRPLKVPAKYEGRTLSDFLRKALAHIPVEDWDREFSARKILGPEKTPVTQDRLVRAGERYYHLWLNLAEPDVNACVRILHEDEAIIVLEKPAPLPVHACGRYNRNTLQHILHEVYAPQKPNAAHRLDANTTGILLVTRTRHFAGRLQPQFARGEIQKRYLARVIGHPTDDRFECDLPIGEQTLQTGARQADREGLPAETRFVVLQRFDDGTALLEVEPLTGRTNQIRVHLWELGFPIVGDPLYLPERKLGRVQTTDVETEPMCLHSHRITFRHPITQEQVTFESSGPEWRYASGESNSPPNPKLVIADQVSHFRRAGESNA